MKLYSMITEFKDFYSVVVARYRLARYPIATLNVLHSVQTARDDLRLLSDPDFFAIQAEGITREFILSEASEALANAENILRFLRPDILPSIPDE